MSHFQQDFIKVVIEIYGLELDGREIDDVLSVWTRQYDSTWILKAIVESLYRGRYKIVCVESILSSWQRLGNPRYQFTPEYEREILAQIPVIANRDRVNENPIAAHPATVLADSISSRTDPKSADPQSKIDPHAGNRFSRIDCESLDPEESAPFQSLYPLRSAVGYPGNPVDRHDSIDRSANPAPQPLQIGEQPLLNENLAAMSLQPKQQISPDLSYRDRHDRIRPDRHSARPVNRKLFDTLKTIVDPNSQHKLEHNANNSPLLKDRHVDQFEVSIEHNN